jgi:copper chaperone CopZ
MITATYTLRGMTCDHCVRAVTAAVRALPGAEHVDVTLATNQMTVSGRDLPSAEALQRAVREAGYELELHAGDQ